MAMHRRGRDRDQPGRHRGGRAAAAAPAANSLVGLARGQAAVVQAIQGGPGIARRLAALGIVPGTRVTVLSSSSNGPLIVEARDSRLALGRGEAMKIIVAVEAG